MSKQIHTKSGKITGKQRYKCHTCKRQFIDRVKIDKSKLWTDYISGKQTYSQLSLTYGISKRTVQRYLESIIVEAPNLTPSPIVLLMDTTYFGRAFGVMLFKDAYTGRNLLKYYVNSETNQKYREGIDKLISKGYIIHGIVCDGRKGLLNLIPKIPIQMCQFHQTAIIRRYLTKNPKTEAGKELKEFVKLLCKTDKESFSGGLIDWYNRWESFLKEKSLNHKTNKTQYTHRRLRSAYHSLKNNMPWLFTWYDNIELKMPNTTNAIDGHFANLKNKLRNHNGLSIDHKKKI